MHSTCNLGSNSGSGKVDRKVYKGIIGSLLYAISSRPNILFSVYMCGMFQSDPIESQLTVIRGFLGI